MKEFYAEGNLLTTEENRKFFKEPKYLLAAFTSGRILEAVVIMCDTEHNLIVDLGCMKGIIPHNEGAIGIDDGTTRDIAVISRVGKPVSFIITGFKEDNMGKRYAILSRKKAQERCKTYFISKLKSGDIINAKITHLETFGAFCDIGCGNAALLPIDSISVSRISHPKDRFNVGENIRAVVKSNENGKITLSLKELLGTWEENADMFSAGQTVTGIIRSIEDYGIFVELTANLAGLAEPRTDVSIGQFTSVYIKSINREKMKIKLVLIDSFYSNEKPPIKYFYEGNRIEEFNYSPQKAIKQISTKF